MSLSPQAMEPENGDYVRYLEQLQAGKIKELNAMRVSIVDTGDDGMLKVSSPKELELRERQERLVRQERKKDLSRGIVRMTGPVVLLAGVVLIALGMSSGPEDIIPVGMFTLFAGVVLTNEARKRR